MVRKDKEGIKREEEKEGIVSEKEGLDVDDADHHLMLLLHIKSVGTLNGKGEGKGR